MYRCEEHGKLNNHFCENCMKLCECDCSQIITTRFKDLIIDSEDGEKSITIYVEHCDTCGKVFGIQQNKQKMKLLVFVSTQPKNSSVNIDVEKDLGLTQDEWNGLSKTEQHGKIEEYVSGFDPVYWDIDEIQLTS